MYRSLEEAAANCTRNIATGVGQAIVRKDIMPEANRGVLKRYALDEEGDFSQESKSAARIQNLIECSKDDDRATRVNAVCALAELDENAEAAVPALIEAIDDNAWIVRVAAITALGEFGASAESAVGALIEALEKDEVCGTAAIALGRIGPVAKSAIPALTKLRSCKNAFLVWCADEAIRAIKSA